MKSEDGLHQAIPTRANDWKAMQATYCIRGYPIALPQSNPTTCRAPDDGLEGEHHKDAHCHANSKKPAKTGMYAASDDFIGSVKNSWQCKREYNDVPTMIQKVLVSRLSGVSFASSPAGPCPQRRFYHPRRSSGWRQEATWRPVKPRSSCQVVIVSPRWRTKFQDKPHLVAGAK